MANKTIKMAAVAASVFAALTANSAMAASLMVDASETVSVEGSAKNGGLDVAVNASNAIAVKSAAGYTDNDIMTFTLTNGTFKNPADYSLIADKTTGTGSVAVGSTRLSGNAANVISFRLASGTIATGRKFFLSASTTRGTTAVPTINMDTLASEANVTLAYAVTSGFGQSIDSATAKILFSGQKEFYSSESDADATISLENGRVNFGTSGGKPVVTASGSYTLKQSAATNGSVTLDSDDKLDFTITGDMTGVSGIKIGSKAMTISGANATLSLTAAGATAGASAAIPAVFTVDGTTQLDARDYTVAVNLNLDDEDNQTAIAAGTTFANWTVNKLNAIVSAMSLNVSGFSSWLKVVNESVVDATVTATATWTETAGGVKTSGQTEEVSLGVIGSKAITTISEADILAAIGKTDAEGVLDVSLKLSIDAPDEQVHIVAEKKASSTRQVTPVYYGAGRDFKQ